MHTHILSHMQLLQLAKISLTSIVLQESLSSSDLGESTAEEKQCILNIQTSYFYSRWHKHEVYLGVSFFSRLSFS